MKSEKDLLNDAKDYGKIAFLKGLDKRPEADNAFLGFCYRNQQVKLYKMYKYWNFGWEFARDRSKNIK